MSTGTRTTTRDPARRIPTHAIGAAALLALSVVGWSGLVRPWVNSASARARMQSDADAAGREADDLLVKANAATKQSASLQHAAEEAASLLAPASDQNERFAEFSRTAAAYHVTIREMTQEPARRESRVVRVPFKVSGDGAYSDVAALLDGLGTRLPDFAVRSLSLQGNADKPGAAAAFTFEAVWFGNPADSASPAPAAPPSRPAPSAASTPRG